MSTEQIRSQARKVAEQAGIKDEKPLASHEGTFRSRNVAETLGDVIPGADFAIAAMSGKARAIVLVTRENVRLFEGRRLGRLGECRATYPTHARVFAFDDLHLLFPGGEAVVMHAGRSGDLLQATGGRLGFARADSVLRRHGANDECGFGTAVGKTGQKQKAGLSAMLGDIVSGSEIVRTDDQSNLVVFSDLNTRIFDGALVREATQQLAIWPVGTTVEVDLDEVTFPDGRSLRFSSDQTATSVADLMARGQAAIT